MRRHVSLALSLALVVAGAATAGTVAAGASTRAPLVHPHVTIRIVPSTSCTPATLYCFKPADKTVAGGTKVNFKNMSIAPHIVTRCDALHCSGADGGTGTDAGFGSSTIASGTKYSFVFHGAGTYAYYCAVHGYAVMHGTITVT